MARTRLGGICRTLGALALAFASTVGAAGPAVTSGKVLIVPRERVADMELMVTRELLVMINALRGAGYDPVVASETGKEFAGATATVRSDLKLAEVRMSDYVALVMPCMSAPEAFAIPGLAVKLAAEAAAAHSGEGVVQDGNIITSAVCPYAARESGKPDGTAQLMQLLIQSLRSGAY